MPEPLRLVRTRDHRRRGGGELLHRDRGLEATGLRPARDEYTLLLADQVPIAGLMALPKEARDAGARPGWTGYVGVDDVDTYAGRVTRPAGRVHVPPTDIPNVGRFAMVADPQGAVFSLFQPSSDMPPAGSRPDEARPGGLARADGGRRQDRFRLLRRPVRLDQERGDGYGAMGVYQLFAAARMRSAA